MKECILGLAVGTLLGALVVHSCPKAQELIDKGKDMVIKKVEKMKK